MGVVHLREQASKSMTVSPVLQPQSSHTFSATIRWHMLEFDRDQAHRLVAVGERDQLQVDGNIQTRGLMMQKPFSLFLSRCGIPL